jgi:hypothetical protein
MGSGVGLGVIDPDWLGFHIALKMNPFLSYRDWAAKAGANAMGPNQNVGTARGRRPGRPRWRPRIRCYPFAVCRTLLPHHFRTESRELSRAQGKLGRG